MTSPPGALDADMVLRLADRLRDLAARLDEGAVPSARERRLREAIVEVSRLGAHDPAAAAERLDDLAADIPGAVRRS